MYVRIHVQMVHISGHPSRDSYIVDEFLNDVRMYAPQYTKRIVAIFQLFAHVLCITTQNDVSQFDFDVAGKLNYSIHIRQPPERMTAIKHDD